MTCRADDGRQVQQVSAYEIEKETLEKKNFDFKISYRSDNIDMRSGKDSSIYPWREDWIPYYGGQPLYIIHKEFLENIAYFENQMNSWKENYQVHQQLEKSYDMIYKDLCHKIVDVQQAVIYQQFIREYADPSLWEGYKKTYKLWPKSFHSRYLESVLKTLIQDGVRVEGETLQNLIARYKTHSSPIAVSSNTWGEGASVPKEEVFPLEILHLEIPQLDSSVV